MACRVAGVGGRKWLSQFLKKDCIVKTINVPLTASLYDRSLQSLSPTPLLLSL